MAVNKKFLARNGKGVGYFGKFVNQNKNQLDGCRA